MRERAGGREVVAAVSHSQSGGTGHRPDLLQEARIALVVEVGPRLPPSLVVCRAV